MPESYACNLTWTGSSISSASLLFNLENAHLTDMIAMHLLRHRLGSTGQQTSARAQEDHSHGSDASFRLRRVSRAALGSRQHTRESRRPPSTTSTIEHLETAIKLIRNWLSSAFPSSQACLKFKPGRFQALDWASRTKQMATHFIRDIASRC